MADQTKTQIRNNPLDKNNSLVDSIKILSEITRRDIEKIYSTHSIEFNYSSLRGRIFGEQK